MNNAFLKDWVNVTDIRSIEKEDVFQSDPLIYTVTSNRHKYGGMDEESANRIRKALEDSIPKSEKNKIKTRMLKK